MNYLSRLAAVFTSLTLSSCVDTFPPPVSPPYPFEIKGYSIFIDEEPGDYDVITIGGRTYCYFTKKTDDEDYLFIEDKKCDLHSDRIVVFSEDKVIIRYDTKALPPRVGQYLDHILQNHKKYIFKSDTIIF